MSRGVGSPSPDFREDLSKPNLLGQNLVTAFPYQMTAGDFIVLCNAAAAGAIAVTLPAGSTGALVCVKDAKGDAGSNAITVNVTGTDTIEGDASDTISENKGYRWYLFSSALGLWVRVNASIASGVSAAVVLAALAAAAAAISVNNQKLTNVGTPTASGDAATKGYVDGLWQDGASTLVAGTKTINTGITITANSRIIITPSLTGQAGVKYVVTARTVGAPGTGAFTVQAQDATGTLVNTDVSTFDYVIKG